MDKEKIKNLEIVLRSDIENSISHFLDLSKSKSEDHRYLAETISKKIISTVEKELGLFVKIQMMRRKDGA